MRRSLQRSIALLLLPVFLLESTGCHHVEELPAVEAQPPTQADIVGVTTRAGQDISFDSPATIRNDSVWAHVNRTGLVMPVDSVQRWWVRRGDTGKTVFAVLGIAVGVVGVAFVIAVATKESCPFVYSWDGHRYVFDAEPYGGAISRGLERDDYSALPQLRADSGHYRLLVTNEVNETQMTNLLELWAIDHAPGLRVVADESGRLHTLANPLPPTSAVDQSGHDVLSWLVADDRLIWESLPVADSAGSLRDEIVMTFPKPHDATRAKLVARVATGLWGSHMIRAMLELRGAAVENWYHAVDRSSAAADSVRAWAVREELYGLQLQVEEPGGWHVRGILPGSGPFLAEERVVPLDISGVRGDSLRIRIRPPRGFWALNSFSVDYSPDQPLVADTLHPLSASGSDQSDILAAVTAADTLYYAMPNTGDRASVVFPAPAARAGQERTVLLHSRGYYRLHLPPGGKPDTALVRRIVEVPGAALQYSASRYEQWPMAMRHPH